MNVIPHTVIEAFFNTTHIPSFQKENLRFIKVPDEAAGCDIAKQFLYDAVDTTTLLLLSGGKTPKTLYKDFAREKVITPGAVALIDERFGRPYHSLSNESMLQEVGLLSYLVAKNIPFYSILKEGKTRKELADSYNETARYLLRHVLPSIGLLGIGIDGHTAGLPAGQALWQSTNLGQEKTRYVISYADTQGFYKERVTVTFLGLSQVDILLVLVFGEEKKEALLKMLSNGSEEEIPSRFFKRADIARKTLFITDQKV